MEENRGGEWREKRKKDQEENRKIEGKEIRGAREKCGGWEQKRRGIRP